MTTVSDRVRLRPEMNVSTADHRLGPAAWTPCVSLTSVVVVRLIEGLHRLWLKASAGRPR
jgi:hypothetical protein